ncbi:MAG TPA: glycoside hydrolase family 2 TIM barrel-domain containing protein [Armatimonadota bacterium]|nr:glycoside hydrolase family 2 TIM barrel-domain containing protein [Armatimonadota bacterium]
MPKDHSFFSRETLNGSDWELRGYYRHELLLGQTMETRQNIQAMLPAAPATVPGSVQTDLRAAGFLPDWNTGLNSLACEWVPQREWVDRKRFTIPREWAGRQIHLEFRGLDYSGRVYLDSDSLGEFAGTFLTHRFDITASARPGEEQTLQVYFDQAPEIDGQFGMTSQVPLYKPRFGYIWDWCARMVNVGIWDNVTLRATGTAWLTEVSLNPDLDADLHQGTLRVRARVEGEGANRLQVQVEGPGIGTVTAQFPASAALQESMTFDGVQPWWPTALGKQPLYQVTLTLLDNEGAVLDEETRTVGFKHVVWQPCTGASEDAIPYRCVVNGREVFLRGINWVPLSAFYGEVTRAQYERVLKQYQEMGCNLLRVWGGGLCEKDDFYDLCDRLGLMVWQEFPLSSSGYDNWPPEDPAILAELAPVAREMVRRRAHHASHLLWCGGNELQGAMDGSKRGVGRPVTLEHPCIRMFAEIVRELDPGKAFWPTSASGPRFGADKSEYGKGLHHDVHGPWAIVPEPERTAYWWGDDSLFRSEVGVPGASAWETQQRYLGDQKLWPANRENPHWLHHGKWWIPDAVPQVFGHFDLEQPAEQHRFLESSQALQADCYRHAALAARARAGQCAGFLAWMGHDCFFCTANNSVIDVDGLPKRAYYALREVFAPLALGFLPAPDTWESPGNLTGDLILHDERVSGARAGRLQLTVTAVDGRLLYEERRDLSWNEGAVLRLPLQLNPKDAAGQTMTMRLQLATEDGETFAAEYVKRPLR